MVDYITRTGTPSYNKSKFKPHDRQKVRVVKVTHNAAATAIPASNVVNMVTVPADSLIIGADIFVNTLQANTSVKLGVTADDDFFQAAVPTTAAGVPVGRTIGTGSGCLYTNAATNVTITAITNAINAAVVTAYVSYIEMDAQVATN